MQGIHVNLSYLLESQIRLNLDLLPVRRLAAFSKTQFNTRIEINPRISHQSSLEEKVSLAPSFISFATSYRKTQHNWSKLCAPVLGHWGLSSIIVSDNVQKSWLLVLVLSLTPILMIGTWSPEVYGFDTLGWTMKKAEELLSSAWTLLRLQIHLELSLI